MNCKLYRTEIDEMNLGERLSHEAETHLRACQSCASFYGERLALRNLVGDLEQVGAPSDFDFRLRARLAAASSENQRRASGWRFAPGLVSLAIAALFTLTLVGLRIYQNQPFRTDLAQTTDATNATTNAVTNAETAAAHVSIPTGIPNNVSVVEATNETALEATRFEVARKLDTDGDASNVQRRRFRASQVNHGVLKTTRVAANVRGGSTDFTASVRGASVVMSRESAELLREASKRSKPVAVPVSMSAQPLKVVLRDEHGESRVVSIKPVSFGAQNLVGQATRQTRASLASSEGVW